MNRKVFDYLSNKEKINYTCFDNILSYYLSNNFYNLLFNNSLTEIEFFPSIQKNSSSLQVYFNYYNLSAILEFKEKHYEYCIYEHGCSAETLEKSIIKKLYDEEFDIEIFIRNFIRSLEKDIKLFKKNNIKAKVKNRNRLYRGISFVGICIPIFIISLLSIYVLAFDREIKLNWCFLLVIIVSLIIWFVFDIKSKRKK